MHIRHVLVILAIIKTFLVFSFLFLQAMDTESPLGVFCKLKSILFIVNLLTNLELRVFNKNLKTKHLCFQPQHLVSSQFVSQTFY